MLGGFDEDERGGCNLRPLSGRGRDVQLDDRLDNLGGRDRRGGDGRRRGGGGGGSRGRDEVSGPSYYGTVVAMRESEGFGFVKPDPSTGLRPMDIFFHFVTGLHQETDIEEARECTCGPHTHTPEAMSCGLPFAAALPPMPDDIAMHAGLCRHAHPVPYFRGS